MGFYTPQNQIVGLSISYLLNMKSFILHAKNCLNLSKRQGLRIFSTFLFLQIFYFQVPAQDLVKEFNIEFSSDVAQPVEWNIDASELIADEFIAVSLIFEGRNIQSAFDFGQIITTKPYKITANHEGDSDQPDRFVSNLYFIDKSEVGEWLIRLHFKNHELSGSYRVKLRIFIPKINTGLNEKAVKSVTKQILGCRCNELPYISRSEWGARFNLDSSIYIPPASYSKVTHLIIHHSAGTNNSSDWSAVVASYFDFHVNSNGWQDIGYNWLIDPDGVVYQGRGGGDNVVGAHMCGHNKNTMGVCLLGDFQLIPPTDTMVATLEKLLSWKACLEDIDPTGDSDISSYTNHMKNISGHRDGCSPGYTTCPGQFLYQKLESIRNNTASYISSDCETVSSFDVLVDHHKGYPNPVVDRLYGFKGKGTIINSYGQVISHFDVSDENDGIDCHDLQPGIYYLKIDGNFKSQVFPFIKN